MYLKKVAIKKYGREMTGKIFLRIMQLKSVESIDELFLKSGRCHKLVGSRKGQFAMDLIHPYRLVFEPIDARMISVEIEEIVDYH